LFTRYCASCHSHADATGHGIIAAVPAGEKLGAPNLYGFASRDWIAGVLNPEKVAGPDYFGNTAHAEGEMASFVSGDLKDKSATDLADVIVALSAEAALPGQLVADAKDTEQIARGREILANGDVGCMDCHKFRDTDNGGTAPDLTGYGSRAWLTGMIGNPAHASFYGENNDRMPVFVKDPQDPKLNIISQQDLDLLVSWLRGEWVEPVAKEPIEASASDPAAEASPAEAESTAEAAPE
jgi:ubiquinol-cytochrome c reductase cytochrome b subunit